MENERYPYWPMSERPVIRWPNDARLAFWVIPNIEHFRITPGPGADDLGNYAFATRDYGARAGIWRMMDVLDKHHIRATVALNSDVCNFEPQIIKAGVDRHWEWMGHGISNSERLAGMDEATERQTVETVVRTITEHTGAAPRGWLGPGLAETPRTLDLLAENGIIYTGDWCADEQPFPMRVKSGRMISVPYSLELNDIPALNRGYSPEQFFQMICDQFDVLYADSEKSGRVMALCLHPFITGHPYRSKWLDKALEYVVGQSGVWVTTGGEIADWYYQHYYEAAPK